MQRGVDGDNITLLDQVCDVLDVASVQALLQGSGQLLVVGVQQLLAAEALRTDKIAHLHAVCNSANISNAQLQCATSCQGYSTQIAPRALLAV